MRDKSRFSQTVLLGLLTVGLTMGTAHSELSIQEKEPQSSMVNRYVALKNADAKSTELHQLIADLNQRVSINPSDGLAWELLAQIYYNNGYYAYAVYAASEAIDLGYKTDKTQKILLNSSAKVSENQLKADYLTEEVDADFIQEYQRALSKIYGEVHGFNYDESLPKPPAPVVRSRAAKSNTTSRAPRRAPVKKNTRATPVKRKVVPKPVPKAAPVRKPRQSSPRNNSSKPSDPFSILRQN